MSSSHIPATNALLFESGRNGYRIHVRSTLYEYGGTCTVFQFALSHGGPGVGGGRYWGVWIFAWEAGRLSKHLFWNRDNIVVRALSSTCFGSLWQYGSFVTQRAKILLTPYRPPQRGGFGATRERLKNGQCPVWTYNLQLAFVLPGGNPQLCPGQKDKYDVV